MIAWSYSRLKDFETCPLKFYLMYVSKEIKFEETPQILEGTRLHKDLEEFIKGIRGVDEIDKSLSNEVELINNFKTAGYKVEAEHKLSFDKFYNICEWYYKKCCVRGMIDMYAIRDSEATIIDWKTGKFYPDEDQIRLMICLAFMENERQYQEDEENVVRLQSIEGTLLFIKEHKATDSIKINKSEYKDIFKSFEDRAYWIKKAHIRNEWFPIENKFCNYCSANCEQCKYKK